MRPWLCRHVPVATGGGNGLPGLVYLVTREGLLILIAIVAGVRVFGGDTRDEGDMRATLTYVALVVALGGLAAIPVAMPG